MLKSSKIVNELQLKNFGVKGWQYNPNLSCLHCGKKGKLGFLLSGTVQITHCFYCDHKKPIATYLKGINRRDLLQYANDVMIDAKLSENAFKTDKNTVKNELPEIELPLGFTPCLQDSYLDGRGFTEFQYKLFNVGTSKLDPHVANKYVIFVLKENEKIVGWLARSRMSKKWHDENLKAFKEGREHLRLRYRNSDNTDFGNLIGGINELTDKTDTVIIVEGLFDKAATDRKMDLYGTPEMKCIFTFGNKISQLQIYKLKQRGIKKVILLYDNGTIYQSKKYALDLDKHFVTYIAEIKQPDADPDTLTQSELLACFDTLKRPFEFNFDKMNVKKFEVK